MQQTETRIIILTFLTFFSASKERRQVVARWEMWPHEYAKTAMNHTQRQGAGNFGICLGASPPFLSLSPFLSFAFFPFPLWLSIFPFLLSPSSSFRVFPLYLQYLLLFLLLYFSLYTILVYAISLVSLLPSFCRYFSSSFPFPLFSLPPSILPLSFALCFSLCFLCIFVLLLPFPFLLLCVSFISFSSQHPFLSFNPFTPLFLSFFPRHAYPSFSLHSHPFFIIQVVASVL